MTRQRRNYHSLIERPLLGRQGIVPLVDNLPGDPVGVRRLVYLPDCHEVLNIIVKLLVYVVHGWPPSQNAAQS